MTWFYVFLTAIFQGLSEFLPVSSSGHLVFLSHVFGFKEDPQHLFYFLVLHMGTLVAVFIAFYKDLFELLKGVLSKDREALWYVLMLGLSTFTTMIVYVLNKKIFEDSYDFLWVVAIGWMITAIYNVIADKASEQKPLLKLSQTPSLITWQMALFVGLMQGIAIFPGISRSGSCIVACLIVGLSRTEAFKYAFLLSILAIGGGFLMELKDVLKNEIIFSIPMYFSGFLISALVGYGSIVLLKIILKKKFFYLFSIYLLLMSFVALGISFGFITF